MIPAEFEKRFIDINFDIMLSDTCDGVSSECYIDYTNYKLRYLINSSKRYEEYRTLHKTMYPKKQVDDVGDVLFRFTNTSKISKKCKDLVIQQRLELSNFKDYISKINVIDNKTKTKSTKITKNRFSV